MAIHWLERGFALLVVLSAGCGLLLASRVLEGPEKRRRGFFCYYTNQSNALMLLYHALLLVPGPWAGFLRRSGVQLSMMLSILVTFLVYFCVLTRFGRHRKRMMDELGTRELSNTLVHYVTPLLVLVEWITVMDKTGLGWAQIFGWLLLPACYLLFAVLWSRTGRTFGQNGRHWPYGFMDWEKLGAVGWCRNILMMLVFFWLLGLAFVGLGNIL